MCAAVEAGLFVFGIMVLVKGKFVSRDRVIEGARAYLIGAILVSVFPVAVLLGFLTGLVMWIWNGAPPNANQLQSLAGIDVAVVLLALMAVMVIGSKAGKAKRTTPPPDPRSVNNPPYRPTDPNNPYASPHGGKGDRRDEIT